MASWLDILPGEEINGVFLITPRIQPGGVPIEELHHQTNHWRTHLARMESRQVVFDLGQSDYVGREFVGAVVAILNECERLGGRAAICRLAEHMTGVLNSVRPVTSMELFDSVEDGFDYVLGRSESPETTQAE